MHYFAIIEHLQFQDVLDILFLTAVAYHLYLWFRGTKALKALVGLLVLGIVYTAARSWGLFLTTWAFQILWQVLVILLIILFQSEIRQVLERVNPLQVIGLHSFSKSPEWVANFAKAILLLARQKIGALVVIERTDRVEEWVTAGLPLTGEPIPELLLSIFQKESPLHDGAILIKEGKVVHVACYLPLTSSEGLPKEWGTRHRAALGLSERCDAWVVVVSEERGEVSVARGDKMIHVENLTELSKLILEAITPQHPPKSSWWERLRSLLANRWQLKMGALGLVSLLWLLLAGQQNFEVALSIPVEIKNLPSHMEVVEPDNPTVKVRVRGLRRDASMLSDRNVHAEVDLSSAGRGVTTFRIGPDQIVLPDDRVQIVNIEPPQMTFKFQRTS